MRQYNTKLIDEIIIEYNFRLDDILNHLKNCLNKQDYDEIMYDLLEKEKINDIYEKVESGYYRNNDCWF